MSMTKEEYLAKVQREAMDEARNHERRTMSMLMQGAKDFDERYQRLRDFTHKSIIWRIAHGS